MYLRLSTAHCLSSRKYHIIFQYQRCFLASVIVSHSQVSLSHAVAACWGVYPHFTLQIGTFEHCGEIRSALPKNTHKHMHNHTHSYSMGVWVCHACSINIVRFYIGSYSNIHSDTHPYRATVLPEAALEIAGQRVQLDCSLTDGWLVVCVNILTTAWTAHTSRKSPADKTRSTRLHSHVFFWMVTSS